MSFRRHKLLERQIRRRLGGIGPGERLDPSALDADSLGAFLDDVDAAYRQADSDHALLERSLELTSQELIEQNKRLWTELEERTQMQDQLQQELAQRREAEESLRRSLVRLDEAQRVAQIGYWEVIVGQGSVFWSDQIYRIFGYAPGAVTPSLALFGQTVSEETVARIQSLIQETHDSNVRGMQVPITRHDGVRRILRASGEVVRDADGHVTHVYGVCTDITEEEERRVELVRAKEHAEGLLRLKTALLNNMSHELRTPLTGILGYAQLLVEEVPEAQQSFAAAIVDGGHQLLGTLNAVLDLAELESGTYQIHPAPVDIRAEAAETVALLQPLAAEKGLVLALADGGAQAWALADRAAAYRILTNLVGNAVKFTEDGTVTVAVDVVRRGGTGLPRVRLRVADTGPGIAPSFLPHLFSDFRQESEGTERRHEGNGLGLAITKRLVDLMDGTIHVDSEPGVGTVFDVTFPLASAAPGTDDAPTAPAGAVWA